MTAECAFHIVVATNNESCLNANLLASPDILSGAVPVHLVRDAKSATAAYNAGIDETHAPYLIFAHQDVYFPAGWFDQLAASIADLGRIDPHWALVGPYGIRVDDTPSGYVWSSSISGVTGRIPRQPEPVQSFDELCMVLRRCSDLRFDDKLPGFHMYGTDIVQAALAVGLGAYAAFLPLVHNDSFHVMLRQDFVRSYKFMRRKWVGQLPIRTPVTRISWHGFELIIKRARMWKSIKKRRDHALRTDVDPALYAERLMDAVRAQRP